MVDLGQKKANTRLPFFMSEIFGVASDNYRDFLLELNCEPFPFSPKHSFVFFYASNLQGGEK